MPQYIIPDNNVDENGNPLDKNTDKKIESLLDNDELKNNVDENGNPILPNGKTLQTILNAQTLIGTTNKFAPGVGNLITVLNATGLNPLQKGRQFLLNEGTIATELIGGAKNVATDNLLNFAKTQLFQTQIDYNKYTSGEIEREYQSSGKGDFGQPLYDVITFCGDANYNNPNPNQNLIDINGKPINARPLIYYDTVWDEKTNNYKQTPITLLPLDNITAKIDIQTEKNNNISEPLGLNNIIFQKINNKKYDINLKCIIASEYSDVFPSEKVTALKNYLEAKTEIRIISYVFNTIFNINYVLVDKYHFYTEENSGRNVCYCDITLFNYKKSYAIIN